VINAFPRKAPVTVQPVEGAVGYQLEFATDGCTSMGVSSTNPEIEFEAPGKGGGKWRVWAIFADGLRSEWRSVKYLQ
jgi:hypothetical protein